METTVKAIVSYRAGRDSRGRLIRSAIELETTVTVPATLAQMGQEISPVIAAAMAVKLTPAACLNAQQNGKLGSYCGKFARLVVDQVCVYHRGSFIGSLTPSRS